MVWQRHMADFSGSGFIEYQKIQMITQALSSTLGLRRDSKISPASRVRVVVQSPCVGEGGLVKAQPGILFDQCIRPN